MVYKVTIKKRALKALENIVMGHFDFPGSNVDFTN